MREKVIKAILDSGENFMSGEQLSKKLGISRTAVWKHINALREEGYNIESVNKKGYRLAEKPDDILSSENIAYNLPTEFIGKKVIHLDTVPVQLLILLHLVYYYTYPFTPLIDTSPDIISCISPFFSFTIKFPFSFISIHLTNSLLLFFIT